VAMHRSGELPDCSGDPSEYGKGFKTWSKAVGEVCRGARARLRVRRTLTPSPTVTLT